MDGHVQRVRKANRRSGWLPLLVFTVLVTGACLLWEILLIPGTVLLAVVGAYLLMTGIYLGRMGDLQIQSGDSEARSQAVGNQRILLAVIVLVGVITLGIALAEKAVA